MKAQVVSQKVYADVLAWSHGMGRTIKRIVVPQADNLAITVDEGCLYVAKFTPGSHKVLREIEIPDELVQKALDFSATQQFLMGAFSAFLA